MYNAVLNNNRYLFYRQKKSRRVFEGNERSKVPLVVQGNETTNKDQTKFKWKMVGVVGRIHENLY